MRCFKLCFIALTIFFQLCCHKSISFEDQSTVRESPRLPSNPDDSIPVLKLKWKYELHPNKLVATIRPSISGDHVTYSISYNEVAPELLIFDKKKGSLIARIENFCASSARFADSQENYQNESKLVMLTESDRVLVVDTEKGILSLNEKGIRMGLGRDVTGYSDNFMLTSTINQGDISKRVEAISITTGASRILFELDLDSIYPNQDIRLPLLFKRKYHDSLLVMGINQWKFGPTKTYSGIEVFNIEKKERVWRRFFEKSTIPFNRTMPVFHDSLFIAHSQDLYAFDLLSGKIKWESEYAPGSSGMTLHQDKLLFIIEGAKPELICLNVNDGSLIWNKHTSGSSSNIIVHKDVIYYIGGGDGLLYVHDIRTGEEYFTMPSPDYATNSNLFFQTTLTLDPEEDLLFMANFRNAICYKIE